MRALAIKLRQNGYEVYDFTDPACRNTPEIPPERFPDQFDPEKHVYADYISSQPEWKDAVMCNKVALEKCYLVVLMLPCGNDSHADAYYALGNGSRLIVCGSPNAGDRTPTHLWADTIVNTDEDVLSAIASIEDAIWWRKEK